VDALPWLHLLPPLLLLLAGPVRLWRVPWWQQQRLSLMQLVMRHHHRHQQQQQ
jgi:hypothetical protein